MNLYEPMPLQKQGLPSFLDQLKLQALRRYEDENRIYAAALDEHVLALEAVVANATDGIALVEGGTRAGLELRIQYVNHAFSDLSGYKAEEILGKSLRVLFASDADTAFEQAVEQGFLRSEAGEVEVECVRRDRTSFHAGIKFTPVLDGRGRVGKWFFQVRDNTEQKKSVENAARLQPLEVENARLKAELSDARDLEARLQLHAVHEPVTGLYNRSYFVERVAEELGDAGIDRPHNGAVLYIGFSNFEEVSQGIGHHAAEHMLIEIARRLKGETVAHHTVAHLKNAEFAVLLEGADAAFALEMGNSLIDVLSEKMEILDRSVTLQPAIGMCSIDPIYKSAAHVVRHADTAMYRATRQGGMRCLWYEDATNMRTLALAKARREMTEAIEREEITVIYQPQLDVLTSPPRLCAVEALARWNHRTQGVLLPDRFFPQAEKNGLGNMLGLHLIRTACRQLKKWQSNVLLPDISLALNISSTLLQDADFFANFVDILAETEIDANVLHLDIPESVFIQNDPTILEMLRRIRHLGVRIVLDNWGKECTSVLMLERFPVDAVKLDRSLVSSLHDSKAKIELTRLLISYIKSIGLTPSASGVSTPFESKTLQDLGCTILQGDMFSRPESSDSVNTLLEEGTRSLLRA